MVADAQNHVLDVAQEHVVVVGIGAIQRVGEPEILPHDDAKLVAGLEELVVADLPDPVADHGEVHVAVVAHGGVVLAGTVAQHGLAKAPVPATGARRRPLIQILRAPASSV